MTDIDQLYMQRCLQMAEKGLGRVAPNPMVGAVLVFENRIIGEGYHQLYGQAHAEVNCINNVQEADKKLIPYATLYVSLEPCNHFGKTPPCTDLILKMGIKKVVIGCTDSFEKVNGRGIERLKKEGVEMIDKVMEKECISLNKRFFTFHQQKRPYIILKWAQTADGKIGSGTRERLMISNAYSNQLVHQWRKEEAAIMVGTKTALWDNPQLNNRSGFGPQPIRLVIDKQLQLPGNLHLFDQQQPTIVFNHLKQEQEGLVLFQKIAEDENSILQIMEICYQKGIQSILVEGGKTLLQSFLDQGIWDECRVIINEALLAVSGIDAPFSQALTLFKHEKLANDLISYYTKK